MRIHEGLGGQTYGFRILKAVYTVFNLKLHLKILLRIHPKQGQNYSKMPSWVPKTEFFPVFAPKYHIKNAHVVLYQKPYTVFENQK